MAKTRLRINFSPIKNYFFGFNIIRISFKSFMGFISYKSYKHLRSVIVSFSNMMDFLVWFKITTYNFFNNQAMFINISSVLHSKGMINTQNQNVSISVLYSSTFPSIRIFSTKMRKFFTLIPRNLSFFKNRMRNNPCMFSFIPRSKTFFKMCSTSIKANSFRHLITSKIKALFRFLTDTRLSVSTLLSADCGHKNSVNPLDIKSIAYGYT